MAEDNRQYALQIVQSQQNLVGASVAGGAAAVSPNNIESGSSVGILEQVRDITLKSFRKTSEIAKILLDTLSFEKQNERRQRDQATELAKENIGATVKSTPGQISNNAEETKGRFDAAAFVMGTAIAPFFNFIKKIGSIFMPSFLLKLFTPLSKIFGKGGFLMRFLGPLGPIGLIAGGLLLLFKYSDEIVKALTPVVDKIKKLAQENAPLIEAFKNGFDWLFKNIIGGIGRIIGGIIDDLGPLITGFSKLVEGDIMGGLKDLGKGLLNVVLTPINALLRFFEPVLIDIENGFMNTVNSIKNWFVDLGNTISNFVSTIFNYITDIPNKLFEGIKSVGSVLLNFFTVTIPDAIKGAVNSLIDILPLPGFIKNKMKLKTSKMEEAENKVSEFGVKEKYTDRSLNPMGREAKSSPGQFITNEEAFNEATGEGYTAPRLRTTKNENVEEVTAILNRDQMQEFQKLSFDQQLNYLKNLDTKEQERRELIFKLYKERRDFLNNQSDFIPEKKEFATPDDEMNKFMIPKRRQANGLIGDETKGGQTIIVNNQPTNVTSQNDIKKADMYSGSINTNSGDNYFDRAVNGYA
jgi:predicted PurR-regulated permease PerM